MQVIYKDHFFTSWDYNTYLVGRFQSQHKRVSGGVPSFGISLSDRFQTVVFPSWILMAEVAAWLIIWATTVCAKQCCLLPTDFIVTFHSSSSEQLGYTFIPNTRHGRGGDNFWEVGGGGLASRTKFVVRNESCNSYIRTFLSFDFCMCNTAYNLKAAFSSLVFL